VSTINAALESVLAREFEDFVALANCERLSGGANQETYRITMQTPAGERLLCLRRAAGGSAETAPGQPGLAVEAQLFQAAATAGVPEPTIHYVLQPTDGLGPGFIMQWLAGETLGARIARGDEFAAIRSRLAHQCGQLLARIHGIDLDAGGLRNKLEPRDSAEVIRLSWARYQEFATPQPMIDYTARWLLDHLPAPGEPCLVHGDFRNGNLMVSPEHGITAVLDWEGAHIGDPMRDLGWLCTNSWRFGVSDKEVGGFGALQDLLAGYAQESGAPVDPERVKFWIVYGSFNWAIGCLTMAEHYRTGPDATVERPAIGRRSSECQIDCVNLLIPGKVVLPEADARHAAHDDTDMPRSDELLVSVRDFLRTDVMQNTEGRTQFLARVAANSLDIVLREAALGPVYQPRARQLLANLLGESGDYGTLKHGLCRRLRDGTIDLDDVQLQAYLRYATLTQVLIDQPGYSGAQTAMTVV
jgi:aminoglycoside phosphotransferase (APT) family kinase protein